MSANDKDAREEAATMLFIGDLRRQLFIGVDHEWNGLVRDKTAECEQEGMMCDPIQAGILLAEFYKNRATLALFRMEIQETVHGAELQQIV